MYSKIYTYRECRDSVLKMLERYSSDGIENDCGEMKDIVKRLPASINVHLRKLYEEFVREKRKCRVIFSKPSKIYDFGSFRCSRDEPFEAKIVGEALAFYAEVSGSGEISFVTDSGAQRFLISASDGTFETVSGLIDASVGAETVMNIIADSTINVRSLVIYENFYDEALICADGYCSARLPDDCTRILGAYDKDGRNVILSLFELCGASGVITVQNKMAGEYTFEYLVIPTALPENCDDTERIILPPILFDALCYMCAADLCPASMGEIYSKLTYKYREILENYYDRERFSIGTRNSFFRIRGNITLPKRKGAR